ncbi:MAG: hypothetical protein H6737_27960 [Alphaproteobacteria bacterium]|nr:hypothetical protein [Alphaproteobacteria bacterium]
MFAHKPLIIAALLLVGAGCAYSSAMNKGSRFESSGDWANAYAQYDAAAKKKPDEIEAQKARERASNALVDEALRKAQDALAIGDFEVVIERLADAMKYDADRPEVFEIRKKAREDMEKRYKRLWEAKSYKDAYEMLVRTRNLFPDMEHLEKGFDDARAHYTDTAKAELGKKQYPEALKTLRTIVELEPDRQGDIAALEQSILGKWGEDLAAKASSNLRFKKIGAAAVLYARAYEVAGRREHLDKARELASKLQPEGKMSISLKVGGPKDRADYVREGVTAGIANIADTTIVPKLGKLDVRIDVGAQKCTEEDAVTPTEKDFISGQVEEPNPEFHELTANLQAQRDREANAKQKAEVLFPDVEKAEATLKGIDAELETAKREAAEKKASVEEAQTQLDRSKARRDELQTQLDTLTAQGATATADSVRQQLGDMGRIISEWSGEVIKRGDAASTAERKVKSLEVERGPAAEALNRLKTGYDAIMKDKSDAQDQASSLAVKLSSTPQTVWKDVHEMLKYDIHDYTRTCTAPVTVTMKPAWETSQPTSEVYTPSHETKDRAHIGHVKAEVKEDLKVFPEDDKTLVEKGDKATVAELVTWLENLAGDHFRARRTDTAVELVEKPVDATTELVRLYVGAQGRLDESSVKMFQAHVKQHFGLEKIELLNPSSAE